MGTQLPSISTYSPELAGDSRAKSFAQKINGFELNKDIKTPEEVARQRKELKKAAQGLINRGVEVSDGILNMIEMAFRAYDPCFSCATHSLPGEMPMIVNIREKDGTVIRSVKRKN